MINRMFSTKDFLYVIADEKESETEASYLLLIDKSSGEIQEKLKLDYPYEFGVHVAHVYDGKFHLSLHQSEDGVIQRVHYVFSGLKGKFVHR